MNTYSFKKLKKIYYIFLKKPLIYFLFSLILFFFKKRRRKKKTQTLGWDGRLATNRAEGGATTPGAFGGGTSHP
jgi:hypothetical protein